MDGNSLFCIAGLDGPLMSWEGVTNRRYTVAYTTNLSGSWTNVPGATNILGNDQMLIHTVTVSEAAIFYRVNVRMDE